MPRIFDNIELSLATSLQNSLEISDHADFCVGYFNLRGWKFIDQYIEQWSGGDDSCCRLLIGMQSQPRDELRNALSVDKEGNYIDLQTVLRLKKRIAEDFKQQLTYGTPNNEDEAGLRRLSRQIKSKKLIVKLCIGESLHAKLYLIHRKDPNNPTIGFVGSSNLTMSGLAKQGELNVDILDHDACIKLQKWFNNRWNDRWSIDLSENIITVIEESWAREESPTPYQIYLKMAYHLSHEARVGLSEFKIPRDFKNVLLDFQIAAVKIAAHHLMKRGGVLIGDVVGLGKTLIACALARIYQDDFSTETLIICPKNLVSMWEDYVHKYRMIARVLSLSQVLNELPELRRYRVIIIDESQNLRNREGKRYRAIREYISENESRCILLSATPYNKSYLDLSAQLRLFVSEDIDLGIRPERIIQEISETEFIRLHQCPVNSLAAFEKSPYPDDWRDLMRLFLVRRTRRFIKDNYASIDSSKKRKYLSFEDGTRFYFPERIPRTIKIPISDSDENDQYAKLYSENVVDAIDSLKLPRYGLGNYIKENPTVSATHTEKRTLQGLSRAGKRLMGFCRTNLFKRLESGGPAFIQSIERHILRNLIVFHAIENQLALPIGTQDAQMLDPAFYDRDVNDTAQLIGEDDEQEDVLSRYFDRFNPIALSEHKNIAEKIYIFFSKKYRNRFKWLRSLLFDETLKEDLKHDIEILVDVLNFCGPWDPELDPKLLSLERLIKEVHPHDKVLVFSQFADTVQYLSSQLVSRGVTKISGVTGNSDNPARIAWSFSPNTSGQKDKIDPEDELRVLISTDVLSEGQNLQDGWIVVNYDLPWAIIRLIQRAGRVDRIGQSSDKILCYTFLPADGIERIINLRGRVQTRLRENAEIIGADTAFFEGEGNDQLILDIYNEKAGILDSDDDTEVDLSSYAYQIWKNALDKNPGIAKTIPSLPNVVYSSRRFEPTRHAPEGVLLYLRTSDGNDSLAWIDEYGNIVTQSQLAILNAAECDASTPTIKRHDQHHSLVRKGVQHLINREKRIGGQLGRPRGARFRSYQRLKLYAEHVRGTLFHSDELLRAIDEIYRYPLQQSATDTLNRQLRSGISDRELAQLVLTLRDDDRLCIVHDDPRKLDSQILCSMGLFNNLQEEIE